MSLGQKWLQKRFAVISLKPRRLKLSGRNAELYGLSLTTMATTTQMSSTLPP